MIKPSLVSDIAGVTVGVLMPTGILNEHQEIIAPVVSAMAGNSIAGTSGLIGGGIAGSFDELLLESSISKDAYNKHYLTFGAVGMATTNLLGYFNPAVGNSIGMLLGLIAASHEKEITDNILAPVKAASDLYGTYNKFIPTEQLDSHIEEHALALVGSQFFTQFLSLKIMGYQQALTYNFERLDSPGNAVWGNFQKEITNFAIFLFPYAIGQTVSGSIDDYFDKKLRFVLEDKIRTELFSGEIPLQLSQDHSMGGVLRCLPLPPLPLSPRLNGPFFSLGAASVSSSSSSSSGSVSSSSSSISYWAAKSMDCPLTSETCKNALFSIPISTNAA